MMLCYLTKISTNYSYVIKLEFRKIQKEIAVSPVDSCQLIFCPEPPIGSFSLMRFQMAEYRSLD